MKRAWVWLPFAGSVGVEVELPEDADDGAAIEAALAVVDFDVKASEGLDLEFGEIEVLRHIASGNICYAPLFDADVEWQDD